MMNDVLNASDFKLKRKPSKTNDEEVYPKLLIEL